MAKQNINSKQGFTIIEVVLVLAIAGLIFLMVFVALPALQRSQRDTQRRNDISRVSTSLVQYQTNNSTSANRFPTAGTTFEGSASFGDNCSSGACAFVRDYMNAAGSTTNTFQDPDGTYYTVKILSYADGVAKPSTASMDHTVYIYTGAKCVGEDIASDSPNRFAIMYRLEGAGTYCLDDQ